MCALCLAAPTAYAEDGMRIETETIRAAPLTSDQNMAVMAASPPPADDVAPCPRFLNNLEAAEKIVNDIPKNYPSML